MKPTNLKRIVVATNDGPRYVREGSPDLDWNGNPVTFVGLKLTTSKRWAAKFGPGEREVAIRCLHSAFEIGFYRNLGITPSSYCW